MRKLSFKINISNNKKIYSFLDKYQNISIFPDGEFFFIDIFLLEEKDFFSEIKNLEKELIPYKSTIISDLDLAPIYNLNHRSVKSELFSISRVINKRSKKKKYNLFISQNKSFGTGCHESTFLLIKHIELLVKKRFFFQALDLGTGTGILAFILRKLTNANITASDIDIFSKDSFFKNLKKNNLNNIFFQVSNGFKNKNFKRKKFDLIVSNMLLNFQKEMAKSFFLNLENNGILLISGILKNQENEIIIKFSKYKFRLKKKTYMNNWASLIFIKKVFE